MLLICLSSSLNKLDLCWFEFSLSLVYVSSVFISLAICVTGIGYQLQNSVYVYYLTWLKGGKSLLFQSSTATISKFTEKSYTSQKVLLFFNILLRKRIGPFFLVFQIYSWFLFFYQNYALFRSIGFATKLKSTSAILMNVIKIKKT